MPSLVSLVFCSLAALGLMAAPPLKGRRGFPDGTLEAVYVNPDPAAWIPLDLGMPQHSDGFNVSLRHRGVRDAHGTNVQPLMSITAWKLEAPDGMSLGDFSSYLLGQNSMKGLRTENRDGRLYATGTVDYGGYTHVIRRAFVVRGRMGLDVICDSTDTVFEKVREDFEAWVATVALEPRIVPVPVQLPELPGGKEKGVVTVYSHTLEKQKPGGKVEGDFAAMYVKGGMGIFWNRSRPFFKVLVEGRTFAGYGGSSRLAFTADGAFLQLLCADAGEFCPDFATQSPERILLAHRDWEFRYLEETMGASCQLRSWAGKLADGTPILYWDITPEKSRDRELFRHVFCTRYRDGVVVGLSSVEGKDATLERAMDLVYSGTAGIQFAEVPYDLAKLQAQERSQAAGSAKPKAK